MQHPVPTPAEAPAHALAMMVAANGRIDARELATLDQLQAFGHIGVTRDRFIEIARACLADVGSHLCERSWLSAAHMGYIDALLDAVPGIEARRMVCRLASAVIAADGRVTHDERLVYDHALARWRINPAEVTPASLHDRVP